MSYNPKLRGNLLDISTTNVGNTVENNSGENLARVTPIRIDSNGDIRSIDVSIEAHALAAVGVTVDAISDTGAGIIATSGRVENVVTTANNGDLLYVSKTGGLTNVKPEIGSGGFVAGDFIIRVGTLFKNEINPAQQDLLINVNLIGQL